MATTFIKIASVTVGSGGAATITFSSIPATYTDLVLKLSARNTASLGATNSYTLWSLNGVTTNMSGRQLFGGGSSAGSNSYSSSFWGAINDGGTTASTFGNLEIYIPNYAGSTNKSVSVDGVEENNATAAFASMIAGLWSNTAAITSLTIQPQASGNFAQYSTATLYGIKNS